MSEVTISPNCDKAAVREWITYEFFTPRGFGLEHGIAERTVRHLMTLGMPFHGQPHKGSGGIRLSKSAKDWLGMYKVHTQNGHRFDPKRVHPYFMDDLACQVTEEAQAFWRLYGGTQPKDEWLARPENASERRSWKTKFKKIRVPTS